VNPAFWTELFTYKLTFGDVEMRNNSGRSVGNGRKGCAKKHDEADVEGGERGDGKKEKKESARPKTNRGVRSSVLTFGVCTVIDRDQSISASGLRARCIAFGADAALFQR
jgi:hypothetical protein